MTQLPVSVIILTHNEEQNLPDCLRSVTGWAGEIFVVDSGSTDATVSIAGQFGATVIDHPFETHGKQWAWALRNVPFTSEWVFGLDADQRVTPELRDELSQRLRQPERLADVDGMFVKRRQIFRGRWIRHGGYYPKYLLKIFRPQKVLFDDRDLMDHHFYIDGQVLKLNHDIVEANRKEDDIAFWIEKHNRYAVLHAREELLRQRQSSAWLLRAALFGNPDQRVIWLKRRWYRLPLYVRPFLYFFLRYVVQRGFLDGKQGFIFHFLQGFWYRLLVDIHLDEQLRIEGIAREPHALEARVRQ